MAKPLQRTSYYSTADVPHIYDIPFSNKGNFNDNCYITPCCSEAQYEELSETLLKYPAGPLPHQISTENAENNEHLKNIKFSNCNHVSISKVLLSVICNLVLIVLNVYVLIWCVHGNCLITTGDSSKLVYTQDQHYTDLDSDESSEVCILSHDVRCDVGFNPHDVSQFTRMTSEWETPKNMSLCCIPHAHAFQRLAQILHLVRYHEEQTTLPARPNIKGTDVAMTCNVKVTHQTEGNRLQLLDVYGSPCDGGIQIKESRIHFLYLYLAINCTIECDGIIVTGITLDGDMMTQTDTHCHNYRGIRTASVSTSRLLHNGSVIVSYVSDTACVHNDNIYNRIEIIAL